MASPGFPNGSKRRRASCAPNGGKAITVGGGTSAGGTSAGGDAFRSPLAAVDLNATAFVQGDAGGVHSGSGRSKTTAALSTSQAGGGGNDAASADALTGIAPAPSLLPHLGMSATVPMDFDGDDGDDDDDDMDFGGQETFEGWLARVGLEGPGGSFSRGVPGESTTVTRVSQAQLEELEALWHKAGEVETLRKLVENLKDSELEMARREQLALGGWAADFEAATEGAWRDKVEAASAAAAAAKRALQAKDAEAAAAAAAASKERCAAAAAAVESGELRGKLQEAMIAADVASRRVATLEEELKAAGSAAANAANELHGARRAHAAAVKKAEASLAKVEAAEAAARLEREAYEASVDEARRRERRAHAEQLQAVKLEAAGKVEAVRAEVAKARSDGDDGKAALKAALALREQEVEHTRKSAGEAQRMCAMLEAKVTALEARMLEVRAAAEVKVTGLEQQLRDAKATTDAAAARMAALERQLAEAKAATAAAEHAEGVAEEAAAAAKHHAAEKAAAMKAEAEAALHAVRAEAKAAVAAARANASNGSTGRSIAELEAALTRVTHAHAQASVRADAAEARATALDDELATVKVKAAEAAAKMAKQLAAAPATAHQLPPACVPMSGDVQTLQRLGTELAKVAGEKERLEAEVMMLRADKAARAVAPVERARDTGGAAAAEKEKRIGDERDQAAWAAAADAKRAELADLERRVAASDKAVDAKRAELADLERRVAASESRLHRSRAALAAAEGEANKENDAEAGGHLPGRSLPTPRTRARTSLRLSHGYANPLFDDDNEGSGDRGREQKNLSPGTELRRRAVAMGMSASPFAPKRKRASSNH